MTQPYRQGLLRRALNNNRDAFQAVDQQQKKLHAQPQLKRGRLQAFAATPLAEAQVSTKLKLAIVGGGVAGLYAARLLEKSYSNVFDITILEKEDRAGGRISTYKFSEDPYQYGEFGAMRIPASHKEVLDLMGELEGHGVELIPFIFSNKDAFFYVNGKKTGDGKVMTKEYAAANPKELGFIPIDVKLPAPDRAATYAVKPEDFDAVTLYVKDPKDADKYQTVVSLYDIIYKKLGDELTAYAAKKDLEPFFAKYDKYTVYSYFHEVLPQMIKEDCQEPYPEPAKIQGLVDSVLHYAEITSSATGLNHLALVESVLDNRNFESDDWHTVKNGMYHFTDALAKDLKHTKITTGAKVLSMENPATDKTKVTVHWETTHLGIHFNHQETYDAVLVTAPFGSVRFMDIQVPFTYGKKQAIRSLNYDHSTKIFAQFPNRWWEKDNKLVGGASSTDLPVHTVVYPSYGKDDTGKGVLLTTYTWQNDAIMWANADEHTQKQTILANLQALHGGKFNASDVQIKAHTWLEAFALFGPGQFQLMVNAMIPENGVHFAGEHLSTYHAWIIGALHSATRAVREILVLENGLSPEDAWKQFPDSEFTEDTWLDYISRVKPATK